jgi:hypothetical protein
MTETGTVVVVPEKQTVTDIVNEAVGGSYPPAYVAAMAALLPPDLRSPVDIIALGIRAKKSGLDPFTEIHAWKNERGKLQFQIARDGFIYIAGIDPNVESLEFQHVYEGEDFSWEKNGDGAISITHNGGLVTGSLIGAYCCAHMKDDKADHLEMRIVENYRHLMKKANWQYLPEMLITRVIGACVRLVCPDRAGGLYSEADMQLPEVGSVKEIVVKRAKQATEAKIEALAKPVIEDAVPVAEATVIENRYECGLCQKSFKSQQGLAGHMRAHKPKEIKDPTSAPSPETSHVPGDTPPHPSYEGMEDPSAVAKPELVPDTSGDADIDVPAGYLVHQDGALFVVTDADGTVVEGKYYTFADACMAAQNAAYAAQSVPNDAPTPVKLADIYAWCRTHSVHATAVEALVNDPIYEDEFGQFRTDGAEKISSFNLDADARRTLLALVAQRHGTL